MFKNVGTECEEACLDRHLFFHSPFVVLFCWTCMLFVDTVGIVSLFCFSWLTN